MKATDLVERASIVEGRGPESMPSSSRSRRRGIPGRLAGAALGVALVLSSCVLPGVEEPTPEYSHSFRALDRNGDPVAGESLVFTASDFTRFWNRDEEFEGAPLFGGRSIVPSLTIDTEDVELDEEDRLCLSEPIVFMWAESLEVVHEIPVGTCLEDNGRTEFTVEREPGS